jgi:predicted DNA-binding transcriptional regulator YafY
VEPMRLVHTGRVWYLAAWDITRGDWRTFRLDRIEAAYGVRAGAEFVPREPPEDFTTMVSRAISASPYVHEARLRLVCGIDEARQRIPGWVGVLEQSTENECILTLGANSLEAMVALIVNAGVSFELIGSPALAQVLRDVAARLLAGAGPETPANGGQQTAAG